jgi:transposase
MRASAANASWCGASPERLDWLWFRGYGFDDEAPNHSVPSKARARWRGELFEVLFVRTVRECVDAGLVDGTTVHLDGSLVEA